MTIVDEDGRILGVVNVVDAMVVLFALAVVIAGVALFVGGNAEPEGPNRYATVAYEAPLESEATGLQTGEALITQTGGDSYTVRDVYRSVSPRGNGHVVARVTYTGRFTAGNQRLYGGSEVELTVGSHQVDARVQTVNQTQSEFQTETHQVVVETNVNVFSTDALEPGATVTVGGDEVAEITAVETRSDAGDQQHVLVGAELRTRANSPVPTFGGEHLRVGSRVTLVTDDIVIHGRIVRMGSDDPTAAGAG